VAVGKDDDGRIPHGRVLLDLSNKHRRLVDQAPPAAFAVGEIEQAAGDGVIDLLADRKPEARKQ
jgi:hypothetical protein